MAIPGPSHDSGSRWRYWPQKHIMVRGDYVNLPTTSKYRLGGLQCTALGIDLLFDGPVAMVSGAAVHGALCGAGWDSAAASAASLRHRLHSGSQTLRCCHGD